MGWISLRFLRLLHLLPMLSSSALRFSSMLFASVLARACVAWIRASGVVCLSSLPPPFGGDEKKLPSLWKWNDLGGWTPTSTVVNTTVAHASRRESTWNVRRGAKRTTSIDQRKKKDDVSFHWCCCIGSKRKDPPELSVQRIQASLPPHQTKQTLKESGPKAHRKELDDVSLEHLVPKRSSGRRNL